MSERQVLSSEEVDAILKVTQDNPSNTNLGSTPAENAGDNTQRNTMMLNNTAEATKIELEKIINSFLRKKIGIRTQSFEKKTLATCLQEAAEKSVFSVFRVMPSGGYGMLVMDLAFLHQIINHLYGGVFNHDETIVEKPGKAGILIAEKFYQLFLTGFAQACQENGVISFEMVKTTSLPNLTSNLEMEDSVYSLELVFSFEDMESTIRCMFAEDFIQKFLFHIKKSEVKHREKDFWRTAIKSQVVDSFVTVSVTLPDINLKVSDFMSLKDGDILPISDPTLAYVCLNNLKLFRAKAGQSNSKRVAKIVAQI